LITQQNEFRKIKVNLATVVFSYHLLEIVKELESISIPLFRLIQSFSKRELLLLWMKEECERQGMYGIEEMYGAPNQISLSNVIARNQASAKLNSEVIYRRKNGRTWIANILNFRHAEELKFNL